MISRIEAFVEQHHMIEEGDTVIAGVSGGADSVCLLLVLLELQKKLSFSVEAVHIEHGIRGEASIADALFVEKLCQRLNVPFRRFDYCVPAYAEEHGMSEEEAGRALRYQALEETASHYGKSKVAVAHHQNDQAETVLFQMVRGSSVKGMAGMSPVRGKVIRPLLTVSREEIEAYLKERGEQYCMDATNLSTDYARNKVRHQILPVLTELNPQALLHIEQTAEDIRAMEQYVESRVSALWNRYIEELPREEACGQEDLYKKLCIRREITEEHSVLMNTLIHKALAAVAGSSKDIARIHVESVVKLFALQVGRSISLPYHMTAGRTYEGVVITQTAEGTPQTAGTVSAPLPEAEDKGVPLEQCQDFKLHLKKYSGNEAEIPKKAYTKWIDYDKIKDNLCVRTRRQGDFITIDESGRTQKLKQFFVNEKIPGEERDHVLLVADGSHIVWIVGRRISAYYKVSAQTEEILEIRYNGGNEEDE